jgi:hypothetical protein
MLDAPMPDETHILKLSPESSRLSTMFATNLEPRLIDDLEHISDWAGKLHGAIIRIAGVLHVAAHVGWRPWEHPISVEILENAITIGKYFIKHALAAFALMGADEVVDGGKYVLRWIQRQGMQQHKKRDILRGNRGHFKEVADLDPVLRRLCEYGYLREHETERGGPGRKPDKIFLVNPLFLASKSLDYMDRMDRIATPIEFSPISPYSPRGTTLENDKEDDNPDWVSDVESL